MWDFTSSLHARNHSRGLWIHPAPHLLTLAIVNLLRRPPHQTGSLASGLGRARNRQDEGTNGQIWVNPLQDAHPTMEITKNKDRTHHQDTRSREEEDTMLLRQGPNETSARNSPISP